MLEMNHLLISGEIVFFGVVFVVTIGKEHLIVWGFTKEAPLPIFMTTIFSAARTDGLDVPFVASAIRTGFMVTLMLT